MRHLLAAGALALAAMPAGVLAASHIDIVFPVDGEASFVDDFSDQRTGHLHHATDIMAEKMTPVLAVVDGRITFAPQTEPSYGFMITQDGDDGFTYNYIHLNNDTPGTDDGAGGVQFAYASGIETGVRVSAGEHIGYVGDSGNAENVGAHLHFEIYDGDEAVNPYASLVAAQANAGYDFDPAEETANATSINDDKNIVATNSDAACTSGSLIRTPETSTVYYCGRDGGRYFFQNESTFFSWYDDFDDVEFVSADVMASIPLRGVVTYKPGTVLVKLLSVPKVYAVGADGTLRWITSSTAAATLYGDNWSTLVRDLPDSFFPAYQLGDDVARST